MSDWYPDLAWADVDPARHPFDRASVPGAVRAAVLAYDLTPDEPPWHCCHTRGVAYGLAQRYGGWAGGWAWATDPEPHSGATIHSMSLPVPEVRGPEKKTEWFSDILLQWRAWLEQVAEMLKELSDAPRELGVAPVVALVEKQTGGGERWLAECSQVLTWYLESTGVPTRQAEDVADDLAYQHLREWGAVREHEVVSLARAVGQQTAEFSLASLPPREG
ncbi:hypothetical protein ACFWDI_33365 [Streptomyces sp. NPDC060064]|uniref:hypothetical protein n=1 Tax=Streptomyces sp. NPDC060064 TaxID=3347049 RepID=UPI003694FC40